mmetsp:Transcript_1989/g.6475  ORF Transcript_1989/g.6475 Transcript_1989/m.6475 type:complete len:252 (+) Transcript_1989:129-884(+)
MGQLNRLDELYLYGNKITGPIPTQLGQLTALTSLALTGNKLTGTFPLALCNIMPKNKCSAKSWPWPSNSLSAPCGRRGCCDLGVGAACPATPAPTSATCAPVLKLSKSECPEGKKGKNLGGAGRGLYSVDECGKAAGQQQGCDHIQWSEDSNTNKWGWGCLCCDVESGESLQGRANTYYSLYDVTCYGSGGDSSGNGGKPASLAIIIPVVIAAVLLLAAVLFLVRKRVVAARQHRRESMPTVGDDKAEVEA